MKKLIFEGAATALVTPMDKDLKPDLSMLSKIVRWQVEKGIDALVPCGTTGECSTLTPAERIAVIEKTAEAASGRVPIIAGAGSNDTARTISLAQNAEKSGADALLLVTPYYNKCTEKGLIAHFLRVADAVTHPILLYHVPSRTGVKMSLAVREALAAHPNIVGIKEASPELDLVSGTMKHCKEELTVYSGNDDLTLPIMALGGRGVISVTSNLFPAEMHRLTVLLREGKMEEARALHYSLYPLMKALFSAVNPVPVKRAMQWIGFPAGGCRLPLGELDDIPAEKLRTLVEKLKLSSQT